MRKFTCKPFGDVVDLDDPETYSYLPQTTSQLRSKMFEEIGFVYYYMNHCHTDLYLTNESCIKQKERVLQLIQTFAETEKQFLENNLESVRWRQEQLFLFQDEIENMC